MYRVNYGNGQVSGWFFSHREATDYQVKVGFGWVEVYLAGSADEPGDWFHV